MVARTPLRVNVIRMLPVLSWPPTVGAVRSAVTAAAACGPERIQWKFLSVCHHCLLISVQLRHCPKLLHMTYF